MRDAQLLKITYEDRTERITNWQEFREANTCDVGSAIWNSDLLDAVEKLGPSDATEWGGGATVRVSIRRIPMRVAVNDLVRKQYREFENEMTRLVRLTEDHEDDTGSIDTYERVQQLRRRFINHIDEWAQRIKSTRATKAKEQAS